MEGTHTHTPCVIRYPTVEPELNLRVRVQVTYVHFQNIKFT